MQISDFWFNTIMILIIGHVIAVFIYLMIKLSPKKKSKEDGNDQS